MSADERLTAAPAPATRTRSRARTFPNRHLPRSRVVDRLIGPGGFKSGIGSASIECTSDLETGLLGHRDLMPQNRSECREQARPCPWARCRFHLYLEVKANGSIRFNFADLELWEIPETCALDVAERGGASLEEVGALLNLSHERVSQIQEAAAAELGRVLDGEVLPVDRLLPPKIEVEPMGEKQARFERKVSREAMGELFRTGTMRKVKAAHEALGKPLFLAELIRRTKAFDVRKAPERVGALAKEMLTAMGHNLQGVMVTAQVQAEGRRMALRADPDPEFVRALEEKLRRSGGGGVGISTT